MQFLKKTMDVICKVMTMYFLIWCPKEAAVKLKKNNCCDKKTAEYEAYYAETTRWV